jgi:hypothetical protein
MSSAAPTDSEQDSTRTTTIDSPASFRMLLVSVLAAAIGLVAGVVAFALYKLIGLFTNLFFFHRWSADFSSAHGSHPLKKGYRHGSLCTTAEQSPPSQNYDPEVNLRE